MRYGTISEETILDKALEWEVDTVVLSDVNTTSACLNFVRLAQKKGVRPLLGIDFRDGVRQKYIGIARSNDGFYELNRFLSHYKVDGRPFPENAPPLPDVVFIYPLEQVLLLGKEMFSADEYIGIHRDDIRRLRFSSYSQQRDKLVALNTFSFLGKKDHNVHRLLRSIDNNVLLSKLSKDAEAPESDVYMHPKELAGHYAEYPDIIDNTVRLLESCSIDFDFSSDKPHQNKQSYTGNRRKDERLLEELCDTGLSYRYGDSVTTEIRNRLAMELDMIKKMDYVPFFLVNWDIVDYAHRQGYFHVGRGSGANSLVAYLLRITDVDPIELDLYFERFMNVYRTSPPDFDIDFSWTDREDVTRYIFERFGGEGQVALLATYNTFKHSAAVRELGKVFGLPKHEIDKLSKGRFVFDELDKISRLVVIYAQRITGMPNYLSIHAGGILISERPIHYFTATDMPPKGYPTTQFDMIVAEDVGLYKYDILSQRGLGKIKDTARLARINQPDNPPADIHNVRPFFVDPNINTLVRNAQCIGCFYVESPAMRMLLKKLNVGSYLGLVAASSIIRPGVAKSGMMREYIMRHKYPERRKKAHPILLEIMPETYGVMVYQEDVIKVAHHFAGLDLSEADVLRRGMSGKYRSRAEFDQVRDKFIENCRKKGYEDDTTREIWRQIESFAGYAFAKGHSASYAVESYQSLYLKTYYPLEYMVAVLNNGGGFYSPELYVHEARMQGGRIEAPCINKSHFPTWIYGTSIYLGFHMLRGLDEKVGVRIVRERDEQGAFTSLDDFVNRVSIGIEHLELLVRIGAFRSIDPDKRALLWKAYFLLQGRPKKNEYQAQLFSPPRKDFSLPSFERSDKEDAYDEYEILGFSLCNPFDLLKEVLPDPILLSGDMKRFHNRVITLFGYLVTVKNTRTNDQKRMQFGTFIDKDGNWIDTVHFPPTVQKYPFRGKGIYRLKGKVMEEFGFYTLEVFKMERMPHLFSEA